MYTHEDILTLAKAGFNASQIASLINNAPQVQQVPVVPPVQQVPTVPPVQQVPTVPPVQQVPTVPPVQQVPTYMQQVPQTVATNTDPILEAINKLTTTIQASNIVQSGGGASAPQTPEQILAEIINPPIKKE